jgi:hypothetical protein
MIQLSNDLQSIYQLELELGNQIARIDEGLWTDCPYAVVFKSPLHLTEIKERLTIPPSVAYWECHDSHYEFQAGFSSGESRHSVAGPLS